MTLKCKCNKTPEYKFSNKDKLHWYYCTPCKLKASGKTKEEAAENFKKLIDNQPVPATIELLPVPKSKADFLPWVNNNESLLTSNSAQFIDKPETSRMIQKNARYIERADLKNAWNTPEGRQSIIDAMSEALYFGATLPEMGSIVPFKDIVEFIPAVSAFQFALTSGKSEPFTEIHIDPLYQNDLYEMSRKDGEFKFEIKKMGMPRGDIIGIVVQAKDAETGKIIGEAYDEARLMKKAEQHSVSYKYYLQDLDALKKAQAEGKDYIEKESTGQNGKWKKKFFEHDITNPYANADKPEMLKKLAGKSFLWPYMKIRNAKAVVDEWRGNNPTDTSTPEKILDRSLEAVKQDIQDAEFTMDELENKQEPENGKPVKKGKESEENVKLFG